MLFFLLKVVYVFLFYFILYYLEGYLRFFNCLWDWFLLIYLSMKIRYIFNTGLCRTSSTKNNCKFYTNFEMNSNILWPCFYSQKFSFHRTTKKQSSRVSVKSENLFVNLSTHINKLRFLKKFERRLWKV